MFPTHPLAFWHYFDFITVGALTVVLLSLIKAHHKRTGSLLGSISETVAYSKKSSIIFSVSMTILFPLYYAFLWFWVLPLIHAQRGVYYLLVLSALCEMVFVWVPATIGKSKRVHGIAATTVAFAMFLLALLILVQGVDISSIARIGLILFLVSPIATLALMTMKKFRKYTFLYEAIVSVIFLGAISLVAHS